LILISKRLIREAHATNSGVINFLKRNSAYATGLQQIDRWTTQSLSHTFLTYRRGMKAYFTAHLELSSSLTAVNCIEYAVKYLKDAD